MSERTATFDEVSGLVTSGRKVTLLLGAGCSASAGVPTAAEIVSALLQRYPFLQAEPDQSYQNLMRRLQTGERQKFIEGLCENPAIKLNWAHIAIAQLMSKGIVDRVLTTNFDPLLARAAAMARHFPAVYDLAATKHFQAGLVASRAVFHLHGQHTGFVQVHTREDFAEVEAKLSAAVDSAIGERVWIVVGYSGSNDPLIETLAKQDFPFGLYWIAYKDQTPAPDVQGMLLRKPECRVVYGYDADSFFIELARRTGVFRKRDREI